MSDVAEILVRREAFVRADTFNENDRTVEIVWAAGAKVKRYSWDEGYYMEELSMDPKHIRLDRFTSGMSLLDSHDATSMDSRLGTVLPNSVRVEGGKAYATVKLSRKQRAEELLQDLRDGHSFPVSVGYRTHAYEKKEGDGNQLPTLRAIDWEPLELSAVPVPADAGAHSRKENTMPHPLIKTRAPATDPVDEPTEESVRIFGPAEKKRMVEKYGLDQAFYKRHVRKDEAAFRSAVLDALVDEQEPYDIQTGTNAPFFERHRSQSIENPDFRVAAMANALSHRIAPASFELTDQARQFAGLSVLEIAREVLNYRNVATRGMPKGELVERALHTTSDFHHVISTVGETVLLNAYRATPSALKAVARRSTIKDFRPKTSAQLSGFSDLKKVNEHGEFAHGSFKEGAESYKLATYGKIFGMTRQMIINDDINAFGDITRSMGQAAARLEATMLAEQVKLNPAMSDGKAVFHANHGNLASAGAALDETALSAARITMGRQVGLAGELIDVVPAFLVVSLDLQTAAEKLLATIQPATTADVNVFSNRLKLAVDRRLDAKPWYLVADPGLVPSLEYAYLEGEEGPQFMTRDGFDIDGTETRVRLDFGTGWIDHRGWYKNPGV